MGNDVVVIVGAENLFLPRKAVSGGIVRHPDAPERFEQRVRTEMLPAVQRNAEAVFHAARTSVLTDARQFVVNVYLIPRNFIDQQRRTDELEVVGVLHPLIHLPLFFRRRHFHVPLRQFADDLYIFLCHGMSSMLFSVL